MFVFIFNLFYRWTGLALVHRGLTFSWGVGESNPFGGQISEMHAL